MSRLKIRKKSLRLSCRASAEMTCPNKHPSLSKFTLRSAFCPKSDNSSEIAYFTGFDHSSPVLVQYLNIICSFERKKLFQQYLTYLSTTFFSDYTLLLSTIYIMISMFRSFFQNFRFKKCHESTQKLNLISKMSFFDPKGVL